MMKMQNQGNFIRKLDSNNMPNYNKIMVPKGKRISPRNKMNINKKFNMNVRKLNNQGNQTFQQNMPVNSFTNVMNNNSSNNLNLNNNFNMASNKVMKSPLNYRVNPNRMNVNNASNLSRTPKYAGMGTAPNMMNINGNMNANINANNQFANKAGNKYNNYPNMQFSMGNNDMF